MSLITISHLTKTYGSVAAVDNFSLEIPSGCVFGLLGPNGAGKTTTFKCMLNLARSNGGEVRFDGKMLEPHMFERIAYIPERSVLYDWMTVTDHVEMTRRAFKTFSVERALELLAQFDIDPHKKARALSKGMRTAVAVALAFARRPDVLVLDEPTSGLDPINQRAVLNLIVNESARGCTILFSSHQIGQVERAAERIAVMQRGKLALEGSVDDLKAGWKIVEGIMPSEDTPLDGIAGDGRIRRLDRNGRIVRALVRDGSDGVSDRFSASGASGVRIVDLNLEDIFINAVDPSAQTADYVEGA